MHEISVYFLGNKETMQETICMKCQSLFSEE